MSLKKALLLAGAVIAVVFVVTACGTPGPAGPPGPEGPAGPMPSASDLACTECHNDSGLIAQKRAAWETSKHGSGGAMIEEYSNKSCAYCHSGNTFREALAAGKKFNELEAGATEPARQDCYACHPIHTSYSKDDFATRTDAAVDLVVSKANFDGGKGNLCVNCHQARRYMANFAAKDAAGNVIPDQYKTNIRFNTHLSPQSDSLLGVVDVGTALGVEGKPAAHYSMVTDTCVGCHFGEGRNHSFEPQLSACVACHADATSYDVNGFQTKFEEKVKELEEALLAKGMLEEAPGGGYRSVADQVLDTKTAGALYTWGYIEEDASMGVHNPKFFEALVDAAIAALK